MAGNIIPAIATTNAVIAGVIVMEALKVLAGDFNKCKQVSLSLSLSPSLSLSLSLYLSLSPSLSLFLSVCVCVCVCLHTAYISPLLHLLCTSLWCQRWGLWVFSADEGAKLESALQSFPLSLASWHHMVEFVCTYLHSEVHVCV